jgi:hypothetical protein
MGRGGPARIHGWGRSALAGLTAGACDDVMFVSAHLLLRAPLAAAADHLRALLRSDQLERLSLLALADGIRGSALAGLMPPSITVRTVRPYLRNQTTVVQLRWTSPDDAGTAPTLLDGSLELSVDEPGSSRLTLEGIFHPPGLPPAQRNSPQVAAAAVATADSFLARIAAVIAPQPIAQTANR